MNRASMAWSSHVSASTHGSSKKWAARGSKGSASQVAFVALLCTRVLSVPSASLSWNLFITVSTIETIATPTCDGEDHHHDGEAGARRSYKRWYEVPFIYECLL